jgi:tetratricopeptide (TPR) repeat protein
VSLLKARTVPTSILTRGKRLFTPEALSGFGQPLDADGSVVPTPYNNDQQWAMPHARSELAAYSPEHLYEVGLTTAAMGFHTAAIEALRECVARASDHALAWRKLAELLRLAKEDAQAAIADIAAVRASSTASKWEKAAAGEQSAAQLEEAERKLRESFQSKTWEQAAAILREHLVAQPLDAPAMRLLAQLEIMAGDGVTSTWLLERALALCPNYIGARADYAGVLVDAHAQEAAAVQTTLLLAQEPRNEHYRRLYAQAMIHTSNFDAALDTLVGLLRENRGEAGDWLPYAQVLRFLGRRYESMQAFRHCLELQPDSGNAYWGLADLKGDYLTDADIAAMRTQLDESDLDPNSRRYMLYALGQALERAGDFQASFAAYEEGARMFRAMTEERRKRNDTGDDYSESAERVRRMKAVFSRDNFETRLVQAPAPATPDTPIFVVGMPRAGSTLVEQILSSHSQVEGTRELPLVADITRELDISRMLVMKSAYPEYVLDLTRERLAELGARVIESSRAHRKTGRAYFIDKRPWNWVDAGLIHLILPHAKIIDIRREPMAACFAMFKQLLPSAAVHSSELDGIGRYYNRYVSLMDHWQSVLPGRIHFVQYERLVEDTEGEIRRMLEYCGLPFEEGCLRFWESDRAVATPSAEQVRRPIYRDAVEQWRNFEPWLGPLKEALSQPAEV